MVITTIIPDDGAYEDLIKKGRYAPDEPIVCHKGDNFDEESWEQTGDFVKIVFDPYVTEILAVEGSDELVTVSEIKKADILMTEFFAVTGLSQKIEDADAELE